MNGLHRARVTGVLLLTAAALAVGCDDAAKPNSTDAGVDLGTPVDMGPDDSGFDAGPPDTGVFTGIPCEHLPGLYVAGSCSELAANVWPFEPRYVLWSDGAQKERYVYLPPGSTIDATDPDAWIYPVGTKFWKHFSLDGRRLETRFMEKTGPTTWDIRTFAWEAHGEDVREVTDGVVDALGTTHDIPASTTVLNPNGGDCVECHRTKDRSLGFTAIQINHSNAGTELNYLIGSGRVVNWPSTVPISAANVPGDPTNTAARDALGYMHANCGHCHLGVGGVNARASMRLWVPVGIASADLTPTYIDTIGDIATWQYQNQDIQRVHAGSPSTSAVVVRMSSRNPIIQMPWLATEYTDPDGIAAVTSWIQQLTP